MQISDHSQLILNSRMSFQFNFFGAENTESEEVERVRENVPELVRHEILSKRDDALGQVKEIEGVKYRIGKNGEFLALLANLSIFDLIREN